MGRKSISYGKSAKYGERKKYGRLDSKGFAIAALVIFLPVIFAGFLFLYILNTHIEIQSDFNKICRTDLNRTQQILHNELAILMALNKVVKASNFLKVATYILIPAIVAFLPGFAAASARFLRFLSKVQNAVGKFQQLLVKLMKKTMWTGNKLTQLLIIKDFYKYKILLRDFLVLSDFSLNYNQHPEPAIEPEDKTKSPTIYKLKKNFERKQKLFFKWSFISTLGNRFNSGSLKIANPMLGFHHNIQGNCSITLNEEAPWNPIPIKDR